MSNDIGIGTLIGLQMVENMTEREFADEKTRLLNRMREESERLLSETAQKDAMKAVVNATMGELAAVEAGQKVVRRLSDPRNTQARGADFIDTAEHQLNRLSSGRLSFTDASLRLGRSGAIEPDKMVRRDSSQPTVERNASPRAPKL